eukprot:6059128-Pleurochrysis_carterae.AAC.2
MAAAGGGGGESSGGGDGQQPVGEAATPGPTTDRFQSLQVPGGLHFGRGEGSRQGEEVVPCEVGGVPCLIWVGMKDQGKSGQSSRDVGAVGARVGDGGVGCVDGAEGEGSGGGGCCSRGDSSAEGAGAGCVMQTRRRGRPLSRVPPSTMSTPCPTPSNGSSQAPTLMPLDVHVIIVGRRSAWR